MPTLPNAPATTPAISGSVGSGGKNIEADVFVIQALLNKAGAGIKEDGDCGRGTISAIQDYQRNWTSHPDGRVDPGGTAWKNLIAGILKVKRNGYIVLPQVTTNGYTPYSSMDRQFGTPATVAAIIRIATAFAAKYPGLLLNVGDMSFANGAVMDPHQTHRNGRNADIRPIRKDGKNSPVTISSPDYSQERTKALVEIIRADTNFKSVLFNDSTIPGVKPWDGHDNHLHISMKE